MYTLNHHFFDCIDSESKAYFLGLLFADGCVVKTSKTSWRVCIGLNKCDEDILEKFKSTVNYTGPFHKTKIRTTLRMSSAYMGNVLIVHGCVPRKSLILKFPSTVPDKLFWHFLRGYFDGDGCLSISGRGARWSLTSTKPFLNEVAQRLSVHDIHATILKLPGKAYFLSVSGNKQIGRLLELLYSDATYFLQRKHQKMCDFQQLCTQIRPIRKSRIKEFDPLEIVHAYEDGLKISEIEIRFGITNRTMYKILKKHKAALRL